MNDFVAHEKKLLKTRLRLQVTYIECGCGQASCADPEHLVDDRNAPPSVRRKIGLKNSRSA